MIKKIKTTTFIIIKNGEITTSEYVKQMEVL
jgi:hypothetical protein